MTTRFESYRRTSLGRRLAEIVTAPERYGEFRAFSREGFPAVTALISLVKPELETLRRTKQREFDAAKQFVGWAAGKIMRNHGHKIVGRSRVPGGCPLSEQSGPRTQPPMNYRVRPREIGKRRRLRIPIRATPPVAAGSWQATSFGPLMYC